VKNGWPSTGSAGGAPSTSGSITSGPTDVVSVDVVVVAEVGPTIGGVVVAVVVAVVGGVVGGGVVAVVGGGVVAVVVAEVGPTIGGVVVAVVVAVVGGAVDVAVGFGSGEPSDWPKAGVALTVLSTGAAQAEANPVSAAFRRNFRRSNPPTPSSFATLTPGLQPCGWCPGLAT